MTGARILSTTFVLLAICGCWRPMSWSTPFTKLLYFVYAVFVTLLVHSFTVTQLMDMVINVENSNEFTENTYTFLAMFIACCKMISLLVNRENIALLSETLTTKPFKSMNSEENDIRSKLEKLTRINTLRYTFLIEVSVVAIAVSSLMTDYKRRTLTFRAWLPYDYSSSALIYLFTYIYQILSWTAGSLLHVASDALICGLLMQTCCQFDILECRLRKITCDDIKELRNCICHHDQIYQFAAAVNETFRMTIFTQFLVSTLVVCFNLCELVKIDTLNSKFVQTIMYMSCILTQIFIYCWYGNEVKLKSLRLASAIFQMDWATMNKNTRRMLVMMMRRARLPIEFTSAHVVSMNLESFVSLLKTSYSAYNLLQQTQ